LTEISNRELSDFTTGTIYAAINGDVFKDASIIKRFFADERRVLEEYYRGNVHFEIKDADDNKIGELRNYVSSAEISPESQSWYLKGNYTPVADRDLNNQIKQGDAIETLEQWQQRGRVFFYDSETQARLNESELGTMKTGEFRTFFVPKNITIDDWNTSSMDNIISSGGKEIIAGQNVYKHQNTWAMFDADMARNKLATFTKLNDSKDNRVIFEVEGYDGKFDMYILAIETDHWNNAERIFYQDVDGAFKVKALDKAKKAWVNEDVYYRTEQEALDAINKAARFMAENGNWYDADMLCYFCNREVVKTIDKNTGLGINFHINVKEQELQKLKGNRKYVSSKISEIASYQHDNYGLVFIRPDFTWENYNKGVYNDNESLIRSLQGWGNRGNDVVYFYDNRPYGNLPVDVRVESYTSGGKIYYDTRGTAYTTDDDIQITYGLKSIDYKIMQIESQIENSQKILEGLNRGMVMETDLKSGITSIFTGPRAVRQYDSNRMNSQKSSPETVQYDKVTNAYKYTKDGHSYSVTIIYGVRGAEARMDKIKEEFRNAKRYSNMLVNGGVEIKGISSNAIALVDEQFKKLYPDKSSAEVRETLNTSIRADLENVKKILTVELTKDGLSEQDNQYINNLISFFSGEDTDGVDINKLLLSEYAPIFAAEYCKTLLSEITKMPNYDYKTAFELYKLFINGSLIDEGIDKGVMEAYNRLNASGGVTQENLIKFRSIIETTQPDLFHFTFYDFANNRKVQVNYSPMKNTRLRYEGEKVFFLKSRYAGEDLLNIEAKETPVLVYDVDYIMFTMAQLQLKDKLEVKGKPITLKPKTGTRKEYYAEDKISHKMLKVK
jgi:hypothetical protein